jgi:hypothetical protein
MANSGALRLEEDLMQETQLHREEVFDGARQHPYGFYGYSIPTELAVGRRLNVASVGRGILIGLILIATVVESSAQRKKKTSNTTSAPTLTERLAKARSDVIAATNEYKKSLDPVLKIQENDVRIAAELVEKRKGLLAQEIISKKEVEDSERALADAQAKVTETKRLLAEANNVIAETRAEEQLDKLGPSKIGAYQTTAALIRYNGPAQWLLSDAGKVGSFFEAKFHHPLPISAFGQTAVHNQLGFDHRNSVDVALSPDSSEGQALMTYLRSAGIPFIAFRYAVRGSATGAHIHIGYPSHRQAR